MKKLLLANWKMQLDYHGSLKLLKDYRRRLRPQSEVIVLPDFAGLAAAGPLFKGSKLRLGAQDIAAEAVGAYTGEVSARTVKQLGAKYVLIGHSERRLYCGEKAPLLRQKLQQARQAGLIPVFCIGEDQTARRNKKTHLILRRQLEEVLSGEVFTTATSLIIAYEPLWAIGSGKTPAPAEIEATHVFIKGVLAELIGQIPRVLYGGSVSSANAADFLEWPNVDGLLVGGASLKVDEFSKIVNL